MGWRILVAYDFSEAADHALEVALHWVREDGGSLHLVHVIPAPGHPPVATLPVVLGEESARDPRKGPESLLRLLVDERCPTATSQVVVGSSPGEAIVHYADEIGADLIVVGTHGRGPVARAVLGSVSHYVVQHAHCSVLVAREKHRT